VRYIVRAIIDKFQGRSGDTVRRTAEEEEENEKNSTATYLPDEQKKNSAAAIATAMAARTAVAPSIHIYLYRPPAVAAARRRW